MKIKISNKGKKLALVIKISNQLVRETQPSGSRVRDQLWEEETESGPLYSWRECHVIFLVIAINSTIVMAIAV